VRKPDGSFTSHARPSRFSLLRHRVTSFSLLRRWSTLLSRLRSWLVIIRHRRRPPKVTVGEGLVSIIIKVLFPVTNEKREILSDVFLHAENRCCIENQSSQSDHGRSTCILDLIHKGLEISLLVIRRPDLVHQRKGPRDGPVLDIGNVLLSERFTGVDHPLQVVDAVCPETGFIIIQQQTNRRIHVGKDE
jgi:hypothetical protein